ncbi:MAG: hypothetical protein ACYSOP_02125 [Planctomycetota bacterium]
MRRIEVFSVVCMFSLLSVVPYAAHEHNWNADTLTDGFFGLNDALEDSGIEVGFCLTSIYQRNTKGGLSTNNRKGEFSGSYDLELTFDMERLLGMPGSFYMHGEGGWTDSEGIDGTSVGSVFGVNADAIGNRSLDIVELFYGVPLGEQFTLTVGKIDFTGFFDASAYANDETAQFLNGSLVNNPAIPFPDYSSTFSISPKPALPGSWILKTVLLRGHIELACGTILNPKPIQTAVKNIVMTWGSISVATRN